MSRFLRTKSLYYDDVNLIAARGSVQSRKLVPEEKHRIFVAPMTAIVGSTFANTASELGISVILHRFCSIESQVSLFNSIKRKSDNIWSAVGLYESDRLVQLIRSGCSKILIDVANGHSKYVVSRLENICKEFKNDLNSIMCGNVHTSVGYADLDYSSRNVVDPYVRVGIGNGSACLTSREVTGFGRGQITELMECAEYKTDYNLRSKIVADGGIKNPANASKAFAAGADCVMLGSYFAQALEAETHVTGDGTYWGLSSHKQQILNSGQVSRHSEGTVLKVKSELTSLEFLVENLWMSLASAVSYSGKNTLTEFIGSGIFEIKYS